MDTQMLKWDFTLFLVQGAWTLKVHGLEPQSQTYAPVVDAPTCRRLGFFFHSYWNFQSTLYRMWFYYAFNGNSETCTKIMNMSCIHLPRQLSRLFGTCLAVSLDMYLSSIQWSSPCYFVFLKTSNLEAFQIKINSADDQLRSCDFLLFCLISTHIWAKLRACSGRAHPDSNQDTGTVFPLIMKFNQSGNNFFFFLHSFFYC